MRSAALSPTRTERAARARCAAGRAGVRCAPASPLRFLRHSGIYRSDVSFLLFTPGACPAFRSGRCQGIGHAGKNMPCPSSAMSSGRLFLDRVARQQSPSPLHRHRDHKTPDESEKRNYHRTVTASFLPCLTKGCTPNQALIQVYPWLCSACVTTVSPEQATDEPTWMTFSLPQRVIIRSQGRKPSVICLSNLAHGGITVILDTPKRRSA
jgi:hypothetical protein